MKFRFFRRINRASDRRSFQDRRQEPQRLPVEFRNADYGKIIQLMCFDAKEASNSNSDRKQYGNNRYQYSNILQWLNSNAAAGAWYSAKHSADAPPTNANVWNNYNEYDAWAGFLAMLDPKFVAELLTTTQTVARNTVTDGGSYETVTSKCSFRPPQKWGLRMKTISQKERFLRYSATTLPASLILRRNA